MSATSDSSPAESAGDPKGAIWHETDRRSALDRRERPTRIRDAFTTPRRRRLGRRNGEIDRTYVDRFTSRDVALLVGILMLNVFDAAFTLLWLQAGGQEANPIMVWFLEFGDRAFLMQKSVVVGMWLIILLIHKNFRVARIGLRCLLVLYVVILGLHLFLILTGAQPPLPLPDSPPIH